MERKRETFGSRLSVIFAMAGSAIGLGNIWRFPYVAGEHGGAAFVLIYLAATVLVSLPVFVAETLIGRRSRANACEAMSRLAPGRPFWKAVGFLPLFIPTLIASYYSVIGGWSVEFLLKSCTLTFMNTSPEAAQDIFGTFTSSVWAPIVMHLVFLAATLLVVALGVKSGIEQFSKITLPVLFVLIVIIMIYSLSLPGAGAGVRYFLKPDFRELTPRSFAYATGQSFYSLSLGMGAIITYGSYVRRDENILISSAGTAVSDLLFAMLAGLAIMPAVFAAGIAPGAGPGLIFQSVPYIFAKMSLTLPAVSAVTAILFFLTIVVAAMTSCISLVEVGTAYLVEKFHLKRPAACAVLFVICGGLGVLCSLSFGPLHRFTAGGMILFELFDWLSSNVLLLVMGFLAVVFAGFTMRREDVRDELTNGGTIRRNDKVFHVIYFLIKWVAPVAVALIFVTNFIL